MVNKLVSIIILNYKTKDLTIKCVKLVKKSSYGNLKVIVVDNNSEDGIEGDFKDDPETHFIQNSDNLGYSGGNNVGIKYALSLSSDYIFMLNPDTQVEKKTIENLILSMEELGAGIAGPKIYFPNKKTIWYAGGILDRLNVLGLHRGVDEKDLGQYDEVGLTDFATGAAMMVKAEVFHRIGLFDEKYFLYYEDSDFCFRAQFAGFKIVYVPTANVLHMNAQSTGLGSSLQDYYISRNRMLFASKFLPIRTQFALFREAVRNLGVKDKRGAFFDFILGRFGRRS